MIVAQLIAAHNATMECYRRAMIGEPRGPARQPQPSEQAVPHHGELVYRHQRTAIPIASVDREA
jgi:hypothetical protein